MNMTKVTEIPVHCWNCGEVFYIEIANVKAGKLFCSDKCRLEDLKKEIELEKKDREKGIEGS
jgi:formylmethanofuran dehydrogenase subunit E